MLHPFAFGALWALTDWIYSPRLDEGGDDMIGIDPEMLDAMRIQKLRAETGVELLDVHSLMCVKLGTHTVHQLFDDVIFHQCCPLFASVCSGKNGAMTQTWYHNFLDATRDAGVNEEGDAEIICVFVGRQDMAECSGRNVEPMRMQYMRNTLTYKFDKSIRLFSPLKLRLHFTGRINKYQVNRYGPYPKLVEKRVMDT